MAGNVPIRDSVGAAFAFVRENVRFVAIAAVAGAAALTLVGALALAMPALGLITLLASSLAQAFVYAALVGAALFGSDAARMRWSRDGGRVWAAMAIIGFFLFIVMFVASIVASIVLVAGPLGPYLNDLQGAGADNAAVMEVMLRFADDNPVALLLLMLFFGAIWLLLTSRLYLAAPASVDQQRILTFETWKWTKGAMMRIVGARLLLLAPAHIFAGALSHLVGRAAGLNTLDPATTAAVASANPVGYLLFVFVSGLITFSLYSSLEAGLSSYLYRGLRPAEPPQPGL
jgi:hypothetical protein